MASGRASPSPPSRYPSLFVHLAPSVFSRSRTEISCGDEGGREVSLAGNTHKSLPLKYRSGFLRARQRIAIPAYTQACLIDLLDLCFCGGFPGSPPPRLAGNRCVLTLRWRAFKSSGFDGPPIFFRIAGATPRHFISASLWSDGWPAARLSRGFMCI